jgi:hypothetical protein
VLKTDPNNAQAHVDLGDIRQRQADEQRGKTVTMTPSSKLKRAQALYEEAKAHYAKGQDDPALRDYARAKLDYVDKELQKVINELKFRGDL